MDENQLKSPQHNKVRNFLRVAGPIIAGLGIILIIIGMVSFFMAFSNSGLGPPRFFWCVFVGMPLIFIGLVMCKLGYMGAISRYLAGEMAPVAKDTVNYMGENIQPGVKAVSKAVAEGILEARKEHESK